MTDPSRGTGRIVVVDDQLMFAQVVAVALARHGFDASSADLSPGTRLTALVSRLERDPPDVMLVDLDLGEFGDGDVLIQPAVRAGIEVIVVTDSTDQGDQDRALESGARSILRKTQSLSDLVHEVSGLLSERHGLAAST